MGRIFGSCLGLFAALLAIGFVDVQFLKARISRLEQQPVHPASLFEGPTGNMEPGHVAYVMGRIDKASPGVRVDRSKAVATYNRARFAGLSASEATKAATEAK